MKCLKVGGRHQMSVETIKQNTLLHMQILVVVQMVNQL